MKTIPFLFLFLSICVFAQTNPCSTKQHNQFDFWLGEWEVLNPSGLKVGENTITKIENNCVLQEKWVGAKTTTGTSLNYYDTNEKLWNQLWLDNAGSVLKLKGNSPKKNQMILKSEIIESEQGKYYNQITWTKNEDETVTQHWEIYTEDGKAIRTLFLGTYKKKS